MAGLTQIGQVPGDTTPQVRRLLNSLVNTPDQWITGGTLSVQASGERTGKIDLDTEGATLGQVLRFNGTNPEWSSEITVNITGNVTGNVMGNVTGTVSDISNHGIGDLSDVEITAVASGHILKWDGSEWVNNTLADAGIAATTHTHDLDDLTDVTYGSGDLAITELDTVTTSATAQNTAGRSLTVSGGNTTADGQNDVAGGDLIIEGGLGKGAGAGGAVRVKVAPAGATGNSLNSLTEVMTILPSKMIGLNADPSSAMGTLTIDGVPTASVNAFSFGAGPNFSASPHTVSHDADYSAAGSLEATIVPTADLIDGDGGFNGGTSGLNLVAQTETGTTFDIDDNKAIIAGDFVAKHRGAASSTIKRATAGNFTISNTGHIETAQVLAVGSSGNLDAGSAQCDNQFGIYAFNGNDRHYFAGTVGLGTETPDESNRIHIVGDSELDGVVTIDGNVSEEEGSHPSLSVPAGELASLAGLATTLSATLAASTGSVSDAVVNVANGNIFLNRLAETADGRKVIMRLSQEATGKSEDIVVKAADGSPDSITIEGGGRGASPQTFTVSEGEPVTVSHLITLPSQVRLYLKNTFTDPASSTVEGPDEAGESHLIIKRRRMATGTGSQTATDVYLSMDVLSPASPSTVAMTDTANFQDVTIHALHGSITCSAANAAINGGDFGVFTVTNEKVSAGDVIVCSLGSDFLSSISLVVSTHNVSDGSFKILVNNPGSTNYASAPMTINFRVIPGNALLWNASTTEP
jgi:hypothetical protein